MYVGSRDGSEMLVVEHGPVMSGHARDRRSIGSRNSNPAVV
jgi:hypothetical protein